MMPELTTSGVAVSSNWPYSHSKIEPVYGLLGVILFIFVCGFMPFDDTSIRELIRQQSEKLKFPRGSSISKECRTTIRQILTVDPKKRIKLAQLKESEWMRRDFSPSGPVDEAEESGTAQPSPLHITDNVADDLEADDELDRLAMGAAPSTNTHASPTAPSRMGNYEAHVHTVPASGPTKHS